MKITRITPILVNPGWGKRWLFVKAETDEAALARLSDDPFPPRRLPTPGDEKV